MSNNYVAVVSEYTDKYYAAKCTREDLFKKSFATHDELAKAYQAMVDAAMAIAEQTLP